MHVELHVHAARPFHHGIAPDWVRKNCDNDICTVRPCRLQRGVNIGD